MKYFSKNVRFLRQQTSLTQADIEKKLGVKRTAWNNYESGVSKPNLEGFIVIAKFFDVAEDDLLHLDLSKNYPQAEKHITKRPGYGEAEENNQTTITDLRKTITAMEKIIEFDTQIKNELTLRIEKANRSIAEYKARVQELERKNKSRK